MRTYTQNTSSSMPYKCKTLLRWGRGRDKISRHSTAWLEQGNFTESVPPTVGSHMGRTWKNSSSSQLQGGYVKVNAAAKERTPNLVFSNMRLSTCSLRTGFQNPQLSFSASAAKSVISEAENELRQGPLSKRLTDVLRMAQLQKVSCLPMQAPVTDGTCET